MTHCTGYRYGCTCSPCLTRYIATHANTCTYGTDPRLHMLVPCTGHTEEPSTPSPNTDINSSTSS